MKASYSLLEIYDDIIFGSLNPLHLNISNHASKILTVYLTEKLGAPKDLQLIKSRVKDNKAVVVDKQNISSAHPLASKFIYHNDLPFNDSIEDLFPDTILQNIDVDLKNVVFTSSKSKNSNLTTYSFCVETSWRKIKFDRLKYCYYYNLLEEYSFNIKSRLRLKNFEYDESTFGKLVQKIQETLLLNIKELLVIHTVNPKLINYKVEKSYTNDHHFAIIYKSMIKLLDYLFENYNQHFNKNHPIPFYSEKININNIDTKINKIKRSFNRSSINPKLQKIINEQFRRIIEIDHPNRLTYHEFDYFILLINGIHNHIANAPDGILSEEEIVSLLISHRFNNYNFLTCLISEYRKDLHSILNLQERRFQLLELNKNVNQSFEAIKISYDPEAKNISEVLQTWFEQELKLIDEKIKIKKASPVISESESMKIESLLNTMELSVFIKLMNDSKVIKAKNYQDLARWICATYNTAIKERFSISQTRNNLYSKDTLVLENVRDKIIDMLNLINSKLK